MPFSKAFRNDVRLWTVDSLIISLLIQTLQLKAPNCAKLIKGLSYLKLLDTFIKFKIEFSQKE